MTQDRVEILLCTYNSETYLPDLLESLAGQTHRDFHLVVSDDCSTDRTIEILEAATGFQNPPRIIRRDRPSGGAKQHFNAQLLETRADYAFMADHDDIWRPEKVASALARLKALEARHGAATPILVHGDLTVIDGAGRETLPSFWAYKAIDPRFGTRIETALMHASVVGCTVAVNRALLARIGTIPPGAVMHDWWMNLIAAAFGVVDYDPEPRILYRIHGRNTSKPKRTTLKRALSRWENVRHGRRWIRRRLEQGDAFLEAYRADVPPETRATLETFAAIRRAGPIRKRQLMLMGGFRSPDRWRDIAALLLV